MCVVIVVFRARGEKGGCTLFELLCSLTLAVCLSRGATPWFLDINELDLPSTMKIHIDNDDISKFTVDFVPVEGMWRNGKFTFKFEVPVKDYPHKPPVAVCLTKVRLGGFFPPPPPSYTASCFLFSRARDRKLTMHTSMSFFRKGLPSEHQQRRQNLP